MPALSLLHDIFLTGFIERRQLDFILIIFRLDCG